MSTISMSSTSSILTLLLIVLFLLGSQTALSLRGPKLQSDPEPAQIMIDGSSSMSKIDESPSMNKIAPTKSMIAGFFSHMFPLKGWPYPKYPPFTMVNPNVPTNPSGAQEETQKLPTSPSKGDNKDGGNA